MRLATLGNLVTVEIRAVFAMPPVGAARSRSPAGTVLANKILYPVQQRIIVPRSQDSTERPGEMGREEALLPRVNFIESGRFLSEAGLGSTPFEQQV